MLRITVIVAALAVPSILSQVSTDAKPSFIVASVKPARQTRGWELRYSREAGSLPVALN